MLLSNRINQILRVSASVCLLTALTACAHKPQSVVAPIALPKVTSAQIAKVARHRLRADGAKVAIVGETVRVIIPNDSVFLPNSPVLRFAGIRHTLLDLVEYINHSDVVTAQVAVYGPKYPVSKQQARLAKLRSQHLIRKLVRMQADVRLITAEGDLRTTSRRSKLLFKPQAYNGKTIIYFRTNPYNWL